MVPVERRSPKNTRVFVEKPPDPVKNKTLVPLMIQSAKTDDNGNWTCRSGDLTQVIDVLVGEKATISLKDNMDANEGHSATLNCHSKGYPTPDIQWYRGSNPITNETDPLKYTIRSEDNNLRLTIKNLTHMDAGPYRCKVTQGRLSTYTEKTLNLNVKHKPVMEFTSAQEVYAILNETKKITCNAIANPPPKFEWHKRRNNFDVRPEPEDSIHTSPDKTSSVLEIHMYNESFLGEYVCTATNTRGRESVVFHVSLGNKPNPPDFISCIHATDTELIFNVTCSACNMEREDEELAPRPDNLRTLGYSFELVPLIPGFNIPNWDNATEISVDLEDPDNTTFPVGPLNNSTQYYVRVRTRNAAGYSTWLEMDEKPWTTDFAIKMMMPCTIIIISLLLTLNY